MFAGHSHGGGHTHGGGHSHQRKKRESDDANAMVLPMITPGVISGPNLENLDPDRVVIEIDESATAKARESHELDDLLNS